MRWQWLVVIAALLWSVEAKAQDVEAAEEPAPTDDTADVEVEDGPATEEQVDVTRESRTEDLTTGEVLVRARAEEVFRAGGSVHVMGEEELEQLDYNDPLAVLTQVPGVYVRTEEGYGLRPNIGIRGASAERSRKITLMEDGVLLAPAPYSAPAAYYFPLMARMTGVEVTAGPAAILYGPHTVGGAIDLQGRQIPGRREGRIDLSLGNTWYGRAHLYYGDSNEWGGFLVEALHLRSSGFHELDAPPGGNRDTGFHRTDIIARGELHGSLDRDFYHRLEVTFGLGLEQSNETYLGLSDQDFRDNPYRRYAATQLDRMEWWRTRVQLRYQIESEDMELTVTAYRHDFERTWYRLDHFCDTLAITPAGQLDTCGTRVGFDRILQNPTIYASQYERLTGTLDAEPTDAPLLMARNHRIFAVQGIQANGRVSFDTGPFAHRIDYGARVHFDEITRNHTGDTYYLLQQQMVLQNAGLELEGNHDSAWALAAYASWGVTWERLTISPGFRTELIWLEHEDRYTGRRVSSEQYAFLPGVGVQYALLPELAVFAGAHLGFSPIGPGQEADVLPETAWNYEVGARYGRIDELTHGQLTYFISDYQNLSSICTLASGCTSDMLDRQFNAGAVLVMGIEAEAAHTFVVDELSIPLAASYTWTWSRFMTSFFSTNPQFGQVEIGDHLPYVPEHQLSMRAGFTWRMLALHTNGLFVSQMRDVAGQGDVPDIELTDAYFMLDASASVEVYPGFRVYVRGENLTGAQPLVTRRAWGARGTKPVLVQGGIEIDIR
ncbi:TonB-dependent receptor family protein [Sandaracinus amylolyticus]|uniref:TonB-dependent receptor family protein n=1 Tax=Sandaracinus amylolyticus TaxID=927083 RepID=UPI001F26A2BC|nr:TonB-dependent receptor [Sandaracinus amylolyticus]UJR78415.1 TonB-dependent receptor [Sandaracinus amylolyticus]